MASDFGITTTSESSSFDQRWLASSHGADSGETGTLDLTLIGASRNANGVLVSGIAVGIITATGLYGLFDAAALDGREVLAGFILADIHVEGPVAGTLQASGMSPFALLTHGSIKRSVLPVVAQRTSITYLIASRGQFVYVD